MDALLQTLRAQTLKYAITSGLTLTSRYALQQCSRLLETVDDRAVRAELKVLQRLLDNKIKILSPALDLIELKSGRGNVFLESAVPLAKSLHRDIVGLGKRLENAAAAEEDARGQGRRGRVSPEAHHAELLLIVRDIKELLGRIDRDIPLLQLAITASGEKMSTALTPGISPSRMMQASALLSFADAHFAAEPGRSVQVGPSFTLSLYMLFLGHSQLGSGHAGGVASLSTCDGSENELARDLPYGLGEGERKPIWQEVMHKARVRLCRTPVDWIFDPSRGFRPDSLHAAQAAGNDGHKMNLALLGHADGYSYHLEIVEDLDDGRLHDEEGFKPQPYDDVPLAGIRESIPVHQISKIFYTDTGRILNIGNSDEWDNNPVLLLKRDVNSKSPIRLRQEWFDNSEAGAEAEAEERNSPRPNRTAADASSESVSQDEVNRQLWEEAGKAAEPADTQDGTQRTNLPSHLDPEWLALEVYTGDDVEDVEGGDQEDDDDDTGRSGKNCRLKLAGNPQEPHKRISADLRLMDQIRHLAVRDIDQLDRSTTDLQTAHRDETPESYVGRSPFGAITSSLSLFEMLIRLTSLQEFQQTSHLAIPDHILTFFLEETSTTGLQGEAHWRMRSEAKRRMGFDPYTDALPRENGE